MIGDNKFTLPLVSFLTKDSKFNNHRFLILETTVKSPFKNENVINEKYPSIFNFFKGFISFIREFKNADVVISHGAPVPYYFIFFFHRLRKVIWVIHGGIDLPNNKNPENFKQLIKKLIDQGVKRNIGFHVTHIQEDSGYANSVLGSSVEFLYSPIYLSNVSQRLKESKDFIYNGGFTGKKVLAGNSTDPHNNHKDLFKKIAISDLKPAGVYSILSYGMFKEYTSEVITEGFSLFGSKFVPMTEYLELPEYIKFLDSIDFAVFNHERQEAMGVTIQLLSLAKPIFFNSKSPAYKSFKRRGFVVYSIEDLGLFIKRDSVDLRINRKLLMKQYSQGMLESFYFNL